MFCVGFVANAISGWVRERRAHVPVCPTFVAVLVRLRVVGSDQRVLRGRRPRVARSSCPKSHLKAGLELGQKRLDGLGVEPPSDGFQSRETACCGFEHLQDGSFNGGSRINLGWLTRRTRAGCCGTTLCRQSFQAQNARIEVVGVGSARDGFGVSGLGVAFPETLEELLPMAWLRPFVPLEAAAALPLPFLPKAAFLCANSPEGPMRTTRVFSPAGVVVQIKQTAWMS